MCVLSDVAAAGPADTSYSCEEVESYPTVVVLSKGTIYTVLG